MNPETNETPVAADLPAKKLSLRNLLAKKTNPIYTIGAVLLVAGCVTAIASKLAGSDDTDESTDVTTDTTAA